MQTIYFENFTFDRNTLTYRVVSGGYILMSLIIIITASSVFHALLYSVLLAGFAGLIYWLIIKSHIAYSLTSTHFQQHFYRGGWVIKWNNIHEIGRCTYNHHGWHQPLPWIGIRLKSYTPYLDSICPRIISEILLSQRGLLFSGIKQHPEYQLDFQDIVLDSGAFTTDEGRSYTGLQAMLANRMRYQRKLHGYDVFISAQDIGMTMSDDELIGLARRYIAAAEPEIIQN